MDKATISKQLAQARNEFSRGLDGVVWEANVQRKLKTAIKKKPTLWVSAAAGIGLAIAWITGGSRKKKAPKIHIEAPGKKVDAKAGWYAGIPLAIARLLLPFVQPIALEFLKKALPGLMQRRARR